MGLLRTRGAAQLLVEDGAERFDVVRRRRRMPRGIPRDPTEIATPGRKQIDLTGEVRVEALVRLRGDVADH